MRLSCYLESKCLDNMAEYVALVEGLGKATNMNIKCIEVFGDSHVVIKQVRNSIGCKSYHLKHYQQGVWNLMNKFEAFNIKFIPHIEKYDTNMLENVASNNDPTHDIFSIELICKPSIPNKNQGIFRDEQKIMDFIQSELTSEGSVINDKQHGSLLQDLVS